MDLARRGGFVGLFRRADSGSGGPRTHLAGMETCVPLVEKIRHIRNNR